LTTTAELPAPLDTTKHGGYIITVLLYGCNREYPIIVFHTNSVSAGNIARIPLGIGVPHGLYGCFTADLQACWLVDEIEQRARLSDKTERQGNRWNEVKSDF